MNGNLYQNPTFPGAINGNESDEPNNDLIYEDSIFIEKDNIIKGIIDTIIKAHVSYPNTSSWQNKIFEGKCIACNNEYFLLKVLKTNTYILLKTKDVDYIEFEKTKNS